MYTGGRIILFSLKYLLDHGTHQIENFTLNNFYIQLCTQIAYYMYLEMNFYEKLQAIILQFSRREFLMGGKFLFKVGISVFCRCAVI